LAVLAGDGLLTHAFSLMLSDALNDPAPEKIRAAYLLSEASGPLGMIGGQVLDMASEAKAIDKSCLDAIHLHKTGALIAVALQMGAVLGQASETEITALRNYGLYLGKAFQIIDDVLDKTSTTAELGKPIASDERNFKTTYLSFYDVDTCYQIAEELTQKAIDSLKHVHGDTHLLEAIAKKMVHRKN
jgi:geranylgeranyl diphosphate synthase type II